MIQSNKLSCDKEGTLAGAVLMSFFLEVQLWQGGSKVTKHDGD